MREIRRKALLTQDQVAKFLSISQPAYSLYENGKVEMNFENLIRLADFFSARLGRWVSVDELIGRIDSKFERKEVA